MSNHTLRLFLYSSIAIVAMTLVWGFKMVPKQGALADRELRSSLEQELIVLTGAVRSATSALKYRLLDVLKAEGHDRPTRAFQDSPFQAAALLAWEDSQWKILWNSSKLKDQYQLGAIQEWIREWPLARIAHEDSFFAKVADFDGHPQFAIVVPVRRPNNVPMLGIGVFPAGQFGLSFSSDHRREPRVFDDKGYALSLNHPAYLGASLKREPLVSEALEGDAVTVRLDWKGERGAPMLGLASRMSDSNLFASVQANLTLTGAGSIQAWTYLLFCALGGIALNWFLFVSLVNPLLGQLARAEELVERLRRQPAATSGPAAPSVPVVEVDRVIPSEQLPTLTFLEGASSNGPTSAAVDPVPPEPSRVSVARVVSAALRTLDSRIRDLGISVNLIGLNEVAVAVDPLQLQTAVEEILKNATDAMRESADRQLTVEARVAGGRVLLAVEDTGEGIATENLGKVFDPFFSTRDSEGVARGLGLNVVRRVVEEFAGTVTVSNRGNHGGVRVELEWPVDHAQAAADLDPPVGGEAKAESPAAEEPEISDLDLLEEDFDEGFTVPSAAPRSRELAEWTHVPIRKPRVRSLD